MLKEFYAKAGQATALVQTAKKAGQPEIFDQPDAITKFDKDCLSSAAACSRGKQQASLTTLKISTRKNYSMLPSCQKH